MEFKIKKYQPYHNIVDIRINSNDLTELEKETLNYHLLEMDKNKIVFAFMKAEEVEDSKKDQRDILKILYKIYKKICHINVYLLDKDGTILYNVYYENLQITDINFSKFSYDNLDKLLNIECDFKVETKVISNGKDVFYI